MAGENELWVADGPGCEPWRLTDVDASLWTRLGRNGAWRLVAITTSKEQAREIARALDPDLADFEPHQLGSRRVGTPLAEWGISCVDARVLGMGLATWDDAGAGLLDDEDWNPDAWDWEPPFRDWL